jgi:AhpD family alkylhydroperoxidase
VRVSQINHCAFCVDINSALLAKREVSLAKREVSEQKISGIAEWRQTDLFAPDECLALEYAEAASLNKVDDNLRRRLKERWGDDTIVELTGLIAFQNLSAKFNSALDVPAQGFCRSPR